MKFRPIFPRISVKKLQGKKTVSAAKFIQTLRKFTGNRFQGWIGIIPDVYHPQGII